MYVYICTFMYIRTCACIRTYTCTRAYLYGRNMIKVIPSGGLVEQAAAALFRPQIVVLGSPLRRSPFNPISPRRKQLTLGTRPTVPPHTNLEPTTLMAGRRVPGEPRRPSAAAGVMMVSPLAPWLKPHLRPKKRPAQRPTSADRSTD